MTDKELTTKQLESGIRELKKQLDSITASTLSVESTYQFITNLETKLSDIQNQFNMFRRVYSLDEPIQQRKKEEDREEFLDVVEENTAIINRFLTRMDEQEHPEISYYQAQRQRRLANLQKKLNHIRYLETLEQKFTKKCSCGADHFSIEFINKKGEVVDTLCPETWWWNMSQVALDDGNLVNFTTNTPKQSFVNNYK